MDLRNNSESCKRLYNKVKDGDMVGCSGAGDGDVEGCNGVKDGDLGSTNLGI